MEDHPAKPSFLDKLSAVLSHEPETRTELIDVLRGAYERRLIDDDALSMTEGALQVSEMNVHDIMIPRNQVIMINANADIDAVLPEVIDNGHSRFPVYEDNRDNIIGILLAKDLLRSVHDASISIRSLLRPAIFIPEAKKLNILLRDFRMNRNHMAIVVDEYGSVAGIVTIEDVLEQIVGDIEDEYDYEDSLEDRIVCWPDNRYRVAAKITLDEFNEAFGTAFRSETEHNTLGDFLIHRFGRLPQRGDEVSIDRLRFEIIRTDRCRLRTVAVEQLDEETLDS